MILLIVLAIVAILAWGIVELFLILEEGTPPKDSDLLEMIEKFGSRYNNVGKNWDDCYYIESITDYKVKNIWKSKWSIIFPYYIPDVGAIPIWYKSAGQIDTIFKELKKNSKFENRKRKKLGLD
jgi:hypothetical protein